MKTDAQYADTLTADLISDLDGMQDAIADAYAAAPLRDAYILPAYSELARDSLERAAVVRLLIDVQETDDAEPYPDPVAMFRDIAGGRFVVSRANSDHPLWTVAENVAFRIVHDVLGHYAASVAMGWHPGADSRPAETVCIAAPPVAGFDWPGEVRACVQHVALLPLDARPALFTECLGQTAYAIREGFDTLTQKMADLEPALMDRGRLDIECALSSWESA